MLLLGVSSLPANAAEQPSNYVVYQQSRISINGSSTTMGGLEFFPDNNTVESKEISKTFKGSNSKDYVSTSLVLDNDDSSPLVAGGRKVKITINNIYNSFLFEGFDGSGEVMEEKYYNKPTRASCSILYFDGTKETVVPEVTYINGKRYISASVTFEAKADIKDVTFNFFIDGISEFTSWYATNGYRVISYLGEILGDTYINISIERSSEEAGLLSGILGWIKNTFDAVTSGFSNVVLSITELPAKIWEKISDGLKGLFVPDEEYLAGYKDRWSELLSDRLGAVYQVVEVTFGAWDRVTESDKLDTINMPEVTIPLPEDNEFSFGGYDVKIVPDGFDILATTVKSIVGVVCTLAFINGIRKRYDEIMGVHQ